MNIVRPRSVQLPSEVKAQALFQCVRVRGIHEDDLNHHYNTSNTNNSPLDEFAYRTVVRIGGRIFTGLLHDEGPVNINHSINHNNSNTNNNNNPLSSSQLLLEKHNHSSNNSITNPNTNYQLFPSSTINANTLAELQLGGRINIPSNHLNIATNNYHTSSSGLIDLAGINYGGGTGGATHANHSTQL